MTDVDDATPIATEMVPCTGTELFDSGMCNGCWQTVPSSGVSVVDAPVCAMYPDGQRVAKIPIPHERSVKSYIIDNPSDCSCGGLHGELGQLERVSCLREKIARSPIIAYVDEDREIGWQFNEAVSLLREARRYISTSLGDEIDEALPAIQSALELLARRHA